MFTEHHQAIAVLIARILLGLLFFFQGYDAVFVVKIKNVIATYENNFSNKGIPRFITISASWFTSCTELIGGALLIMGLFEYIALYLLGLNLIIAAIGFGINTPMWDTRYVFPRLILLLILLFVPMNWNIISMDYLLFKPCGIR